MTLALRIQHDLTALLAHETELPCRLTLTGISEHFGVSPMPVRIAVNNLVDAGILIKQDNGRLDVDRSKIPADLPNADSDAPLAESGLDQQIANDVVMRSLTKPEHYLRESATAERFGVGRTVVRRIFSRLSGQGLIEHVPRCGWLVRPYREQDTVDYLTVRETLELKALDLAKDNLDPQVLREMRDANREDGAPADIELDNRLHGYLIEQAGSRYIREFFARNSAYYDAIFDYAALEPEARREMAHQHRDILDALIAGDYARAREALSRHIRDQQSNVTRLIEHLSNREELSD